MYSRNFGGIRSDGQLQELEDNWRKQYSEQRNYDKPDRRPEPTPYTPAPVVKESCETSSPKRLLDFNFDFLKNIQLDDLILIGIGILLLLDSDASNDMLIVLIAIMLFF